MEHCSYFKKVLIFKMCCEFWPITFQSLVYQLYLALGYLKFRYHVPVEVVPSLADVMAALQDGMIRTNVQFIHMYITFVEGWLCECKVFIISHPKNVIAVCSADLPVVHVWCIIVCSLPQTTCSLYGCHGCVFKTADFVFQLIRMTNRCIHFYLFPIYLSQMFSQSDSYLLVVFLSFFSSFFFLFFSFFFFNW